MGIFENLNSYYFTIKIGVKDSLAYTKDRISFALLAIGLALIMVFVWGIIYKFSNTNTILGISLLTLYSYTFFAMALRFGIYSEVAYSMQENVENGDVAILSTRPISYAASKICEDIGHVLVLFISVALPLLILGIFFAHITLTFNLLAVVLIEIILGFIIISAISFILGCLAFYYTNIHGLIQIMWYSMIILSGALIPINFYPHSIYEVLNLLPFKYLAYVPISTLLGIGNINTSNVILYGLLWCTVLIVIMHLMWRKAKKKLSAGGG